MHRSIMWLGTGALACGLAGCGLDGEPGEPGERAPELASAEQPSFAYFPMGFARVTAGGAIGAHFNSTGGPIAILGGGGSYTVVFGGLGAGIGASAIGGNVQIVAEGTSNVRCRSTGWGGAPNLSASVECNAPDGSVAASAFAILFYRHTMPAPNPWPAQYAYAFVTGSGVVSNAWDYNASGNHNTVTRTGVGQYRVNITTATAINASMMVTPYGQVAGAVCSVKNWSAGATNVECRDRFGNLADSAFSFSYAVTGPTHWQQGAHAWFDGSAANTTYSAALGKVTGCSPASVTGSRAGSLATMVVAGELGSWDATEFHRASFASAYGAAGYCKVETLNSVEGASSTATTTVRCYSATGAVVAAPLFTFTHATSDASGPC